MSPATSTLQLPRFTLVALACAAAAIGRASGPEVAPTDLHATIAPIFAAARIPGGAALVLRGDQVIAQGVAGVRKRDASEAIAIDDKFHLGSCTKAMTGTLAAVLVEEGKLAWTATVPELFGEAVPKLHEGWGGVTLLQLMAHRTGLPANLGAVLNARFRLSNDPLIEQRRIVAASMFSDAPQQAPGTKFLYSNVGYMVTGAALEKAAGRGWEELMQQKLFAPLGITTGGFGAPGTPGKVDQPWGHRGADFSPVEPGPRADNLPVLGPAGTAHMTMRDWSKFVALHLRGDPRNPQRRVSLLSEKTFAQLHRPEQGESYVAGWGTGTRSWAKGARPDDTGFVLTHSGSNTMWYCVVWMAPEIDFAVLVACNAAGSEAGKACDGVAGALVRQFAAKK